jgi:hypothetical protein
VGGATVEVGFVVLEDRKPKPRPKPKPNPTTKTQEITMMIIQVFESMRFFMCKTKISVIKMGWLTLTDLRANKCAHGFSESEVKLILEMTWKRFYGIIQYCKLNNEKIRPFLLREIYGRNFKNLEYTTAKLVSLLPDLTADNFEDYMIYSLSYGIIQKSGFTYNYLMDYMRNREEIRSVMIFNGKHLH